MKKFLTFSGTAFLEGWLLILCGKTFFLLLHFSAEKESGFHFFHLPRLLMVSVEYPFSKFFGVNKSISWETQSRVRMVFAPRAKKKTNLSNSQGRGGDMKNGGAVFEDSCFETVLLMWNQLEQVF